MTSGRRRIAAHIHPIAARLIVVSMLPNAFGIADREDAGMLDVVGFDTAAPGVMADFARG